MVAARERVLSSWIQSTFAGALLGAGAAALVTPFVEPAVWPVWLGTPHSGVGAPLLADLALRGALLLPMALALAFVVASLDLLLLRFLRVSLPHGPEAWFAPVPCGLALACSLDLRHAAMALAYFPGDTLQLWASAVLAFGLEAAVLRRVMFAIPSGRGRGRAEAA
jgi:hypothetical protein